jgi:hypothetical protein
VFAGTANDELILGHVSVKCTRSRPNRTCVRDEKRDRPRRTAVRADVGESRARCGSPISPTDRFRVSRAWCLSDPYARTSISWTRHARLCRI